MPIITKEVSWLTFHYGSKTSRERGLSPLTLCSSVSWAARSLPQSGSSAAIIEARSARANIEGRQSSEDKTLSRHWPVKSVLMKSITQLEVRISPQIHYKEGSFCYNPLVLSKVNPRPPAESELFTAHPPVFFFSVRFLGYGFLPHLVGSSSRSSFFLGACALKDIVCSLLLLHGQPH